MVLWNSRMDLRGYEQCPMNGGHRHFRGQAALYTFAYLFNDYTGLRSYPSADAIRAR